MLDLEQQLRVYGAHLDALDAEGATETEAVAPVALHRANRVRLVAAGVLVMALVGGSVAVAARRDTSRHLMTVGSGGSGSPTAIADAHPTFAQQVAQLNAWYAHAVADAPGGRPILQAEFEVCDYRSAPALGTGVQKGFASYFPLAQPLTEARLVEGCLHRDDIPKSAVAPHSLCAADVRGPVYDTKATVVKLVTKPVVVFGGADCAAAGYEPLTPGVLAQVNNRRRVEIEIRAVPLGCPTLHEAASWVVKVTAQELGGPWPVVEPAPAAPAVSGVPATIAPRSSAPAGAGSCVRPSRVDWDALLVSLERF